MPAEPTGPTGPGPGSSELFTRLGTEAGRRASYPVVTEPGTVEGGFATVVSRVQPVVGSSVAIERLERHPHGSQSFFPLSVGRWLLAVAPAAADGTPDVARLAVRILGPGDAVCLHRNSWHATLTVFDRPAEIVMMMWRARSGHDTDYFELPAPLVIEVEPRSSER